MLMNEKDSRGYVMWDNYPICKHCGQTLSGGTGAFYCIACRYSLYNKEVVNHDLIISMVELVY